MNIKLVTGNTLETSVEASDDRALYAGIVGTGDYVFGVGQRFAHQIIGYGTVRIFDGEGIMQGAHFIIPNGKYDDIEIAACVEGFKRIDLICARYRKFQNMETVELVVVKGVETTRTPQVPEVIVGSILEDTAEHNMPLKKLTIQGSTIIGIENVFEEIPSISDTNTESKALANGSFTPRGQLTSDNDLNSITLSPGAYWSTMSSPPKNSPDALSDSPCQILIFQSQGSSANIRYVQQVYPQSGGAMYYRVYHYGQDGTWRDWVKVVIEEKWKPLTLAEGVTVANTGGVRDIPSYRKTGNKVEIEGSIAVSIPPNGSVRIVEGIPAGYRPQNSDRAKYSFFTCSGNRMARGYVSTAGNIVIEWVYDITTGSKVSGAVPWIEIDVSYNVD